MTVSGVKIKNARTVKGWSQAKLASKVGISQSHVSDMERGVDSPSAELLGRMAEALGVPVDDFYEKGEN